jgi:hypothetical protein
MAVWLLARIAGIPNCWRRKGAHIAAKKSVPGIDVADTTAPRRPRSSGRAGGLGNVCWFIREYSYPVNWTRRQPRAGGRASLSNTGNNLEKRADKPGTSWEREGVTIRALPLPVRKMSRGVPSAPSRTTATGFPWPSRGHSSLKDK